MDQHKDNHQTLPPKAHEHDDHSAHAVHTHADHSNMKVAEASMPVSATSHPTGHAGHTQAGSGHEGHSADPSGHETMFRTRFWVSLLLTIPVLFYTPMLQMWFGFRAPAFSVSQWIAPIFGVAVFIYGGIPFIQMAVPEVRNRQPGMMLLISLAISVSFIYSLAAAVLNFGEGFFWELVTLIDIMLLGHWIEMRSVRQASGALDALAKLMPDTAEHIMPDGSTHTMPVASLKTGDLVLVRPGAGIPADSKANQMSMKR